MSVLDELRNELHYYLDGIGSDYCRDSVARELFRRIDAFEAAHPGLVDLTRTCPECGVHYPEHVEFSLSCYVNGRCRGVPPDNIPKWVCPACAKEENHD